MLGNVNVTQTLVIIGTVQGQAMLCWTGSQGHHLRFYFLPAAFQNHELEMLAPLHLLSGFLAEVSRERSTLGHPLFFFFLFFSFFGV